MKEHEREVLREALAEALSEYEQTPTPESKAFLLGMRYTVGLLGMPEGNSAYDWSQYEPPRELRRRRILARLQHLRRP